MNTIERVRALFPLGAIVRCVENTYIPKHTGITRRIIDAGVGWRDLAAPAGPNAGRVNFRLHLPHRVRDVVELTDTSVTYRLDEDHTVTWEVLERGDADPATDKNAAAAGTA